CLQYNSFPPTF
nr:immunoglobulin light chain junction region [Macaca mulatta]MOX26515.1 immunoglobulin light chain junction region [Macaca mulatta]MOX26730.1 immunoglobulin light chain junction region [Macaca mulatta]MOX27413.1 immunoglobulin light chain junction region [Macaca mulatta]MOX27636.1 immunoglobulin light chain junction region [Macaca mulatta]